MSFQLIAFDLDDTLVDTFSVSVPNCVEMVNAEYGVPIKLEDWSKTGGYRGKAGQGLLDAIAADYGVAIPFEDFMQKRREWLHKLLHQGMTAAPGMAAAVKALHAQGRTMCVCTNSVSERAALTLKNAITDVSVHLPDVFKQHVYSAVPTMNAKPAPDVYLHAAKVFKVEPRHALAVEDTPTGVAAAVAAGFVAVGYVGLHPDMDEAEETLKMAGAAHVLRHWDGFLPLLAQLEG